MPAGRVLAAVLFQMAGGRSTSLLAKHESPRSTARHARAHVRSRELGKAVQRLSDQWSGSGSTNLRLGSSQNISSQNGHVFTKGTFHELNLSAFMVLNDFNRSLVWFQSLFANNIKTTKPKNTSLSGPVRAGFVSSPWRVRRSDESLHGATAPEAGWNWCSCLGCPRG